MLKSESNCLRVSLLVYRNTLNRIINNSTNNGPIRTILVSVNSPLLDKQATVMCILCLTFAEKSSFFNHHFSGSKEEPGILARNSLNFSDFSLEI
jgi:hypothetical protein